MANYTLKGSGKSSQSSIDAKQLVEVLSRVTNYKFVVYDASADFPPPSDNAGWYLLTNEAISEIGHIRLIWIDGKGRVRTQSMYLGNITEWVEPEYGEEGAIRAMKINYKDAASAEQILSEKFPQAVDRLRTFMNIAREASKKYGINIEVTSEGGEGTATFFLDSIIDVRNLDDAQKMERLKHDLYGIRRAWNEIWGYEAEWLKRHGLK